CLKIRTLEPRVLLLILAGQQGGAHGGILRPCGRGAGSVGPLTATEEGLGILDLRGRKDGERGLRAEVEVEVERSHL
ncbi:hypothetical protein CRG98_004968, partial [Punica granatum]